MAPLSMPRARTRFSLRCRRLTMAKTPSVKMTAFRTGLPPPNLSTASLMSACVVPAEIWVLLVMSYGAST